MGILS
jgi:hypothetical protein